MRYTVRLTDDGRWAVYDLECRREVTRVDVKSHAETLASGMERNARLWRVA